MLLIFAALFMFSSQLKKVALYPVVIVPLQYYSRNVAFILDDGSKLNGDINQLVGGKKPALYVLLYEVCQLPQVN